MEARMKLYRISQNDRDGWDTYDSAVVAAESEDDARTIEPCSWDSAIHRLPREEERAYDSWTNDPAKVTVEYLGEAKEGTPVGVIVASFNAG